MPGVHACQMLLLGVCGHACSVVSEVLAAKSAAAVAPPVAAVARLLLLLMLLLSTIFSCTHVRRWRLLCKLEPRFGNPGDFFGDMLILVSHTPELPGKQWKTGTETAKPP